MFVSLGFISRREFSPAPPPVARVSELVWDTPSDDPFRSLSLAAASQDLHPGVVDGPAGLAAFAALDVDPVLAVLEQFHTVLDAGVAVTGYFPWVRCSGGGKSGCVHRGYLEDRRERVHGTGAGL